MRRMLPIIAAVGLAILAAVLVFLYTKGADQRVLADQQPVDVLVSSALIPKGMSLGDAVSGGLAEQTQVPSAMNPAGSIAGATPENSALLALNDVTPGQILLADNFAAQLPDTSAIPVPDGQIAVSFTLADPERVGTFVRPGSEVVIFDTSASGDAGLVTRVLLDRVLVLAVGDSTATGTTNADGTAAAPSALLTVGVDQAQAEKLIQAIRTGSLYLGLPGAGTDVVKSQGVGDGNLFQ